MPWAVWNGAKARPDLEPLQTTPSKPELGLCSATLGVAPRCSPAKPHPQPFSAGSRQVVHVGWNVRAPCLGLELPQSPGGPSSTRAPPCQAG